MYNRKLWYEHFKPAFWPHSNLCEFTALEYKFERWFCTQKPVLNVHFKDLQKRKVYKNKPDSDLVWQIQLISIKG